MKKALKWILRHLLLLGSLFLLYWGYCWGLWGRDSKLLAFLFPCACPPISEEFRYPEYINVLVPACEDRRISDVSPSKRYLATTGNNFDRGYIYDIKTRSIRKSNLSPYGAKFLTDDIFINYYDNPLQIINLENQNISKFFNIEDLPGILNSHSQPVDLAYTVSLFAKSEKVYFLPQGDSFLLLGIDQYDPGKNIAFGKQYNSKFPETVRSELKRQGIPFECIYFDMYNNINPKKVGPKEFSDNGEFYWENGLKEGVHLTKNDELLTPDVTKYWTIIRWVNQDEGLLLDQEVKYLIGDGSSGFDVWPTSFFRFPQPILLLKVPDEYQTPSNKALHAAQRQNEMIAGVLALIPPLALAGLGFWKYRQSRKKGQPQELP